MYCLKLRKAIKIIEKFTSSSRGSSLSNSFAICGTGGAIGAEIGIWNNNTTNKCCENIK